MIKMNNVSIGYNPKTIIRENIDLQFTDNLIYGILGESGIGKTTFLKTIAGLLKPIKGTIDSSIEKKDIYMMHQNYTSFDWLNCLDNILITQKIKYQKPDKERAMQFLKIVGLEEHAKKFPTQLSGGQRQRLALARTLFMNPKFILMDEPLSALDEETRTDMQDFILKYQKETKCGIIIVTHSPAEADKMCNELIKF